MKMNVLGVKRMTGVSKKTGNDFDMCRLIGMVPIEIFKKEALAISGHGFEVAEIELDPACLGEFSAVKFPALLDLKTDSRPFMGEFKTIVAGINPPAVAPVRAA